MPEQLCWLYINVYKNGSSSSYFKFMFCFQFSSSCIPFAPFPFLWALLLCHYCFCNTGPQFLVAQDQQLCTGHSTHVKYSCTENLQDMDTMAGSEMRLHSGFPKDFDRPWPSGVYFDGGSGQRITMFGNQCWTLGYCLALWVPVWSQHLTNEVSQPPISLICKELIFISLWTHTKKICTT